jgi:SAM-dependent methyltransferase
MPMLSAVEHALAQSIAPKVAVPEPAGRRVPLHDRCWLSRRWIERFVRGQAPSLTGRGLDYGCGESPYAAALRAHCTELIGVDVEQRGPACDLIVARGHALPFADQSFEFIVCTQVLEHAKEPLAILRDLARVLRRDGRLLVTVPFVFEQHEMPSDYWRFTAPGLHHLAAAAGLRVESIEPGGGIGAVIGQLLMLHAPAFGPLHRLTFPLFNLAFAVLDRLLPRSASTCNGSITCNWHAVLRPAPAL